MGVKQLWTLLKPVGRPVLLETLEGKVLAIDSSIWLYQFQATMRDSDGKLLTNAHVLGFLRRICKLLFYGVRPVFVFDGGAPALKKSTLNERRKRKGGAAASHARVAEKLLAAQLRREALKHAHGTQHRPEPEPEIDQDGVFLEDLDGSAPRKKTKGQPFPSPSKKPPKFLDHDPYRLPEIDFGEVISTATRSAVPDPRLATEDELRAFIETMRPEEFDTTSPAFRELPTEVQYEIIGDLRLKSRQTSHSRLQDMLKDATTAIEFSKAQIKGLQQRNKLTQQLLTTTSNMGNTADHHLTIPVRIASERNREYVLTKNDIENGGWILGVSEDGTRSKPIQIDQDDDLSDMEMEEVQILDKHFPDIQEYRQTEDVNLRSQSIDPNPSFTDEYADDPALFLAVHESLAFIAGHNRLSTAADVSKLDSLPSDNQGDLHPAVETSWSPDSTRRSADMSVSSSRFRGDPPHSTQLQVLSYSEDGLYRKPSQKSSAAGAISETTIPSPVVGTALQVDGLEDYSTFGPPSILLPSCTKPVFAELPPSQVKAPRTPLDPRSPPESSASISSSIDGDMLNPPSPAAMDSSEEVGDIPLLPAIDSLGSESIWSAITLPNIPLSSPPLSDFAQAIVSDMEPLDSREEEVFLDDWSRSPSPVLIGEPAIDQQYQKQQRSNVQNPTIEDWDVVNEMDPLAEEDEYAKFISQVRNKSLDTVQNEIEEEILSLKKQKKLASRDIDDLNQQMVSQIMMLLRLFGIPYITAPMEAEAQCATLVSLSLAEGIITDDSDVFLFGGARVFRHMFNQSKTVECFLMSDLERELGLDRDKLVRLAYLLGSDYVEGLPGVGPVVAMELMKEFPGEDGLHKFKDWWSKVQTGKDKPEDNKSAFRQRFRKKFKTLHIGSDWPNPLVRDAYYHPSVDDSEEPFKWGLPDLDALRDFLGAELHWNQGKVDELLLPIIRKMGQREQANAANKQGTLNAFFDISVGTGTYAPRRRQAYASSRLQKVVSDFRKEQRGRSFSTEESHTEPEGKGKGKARANAKEAKRAPASAKEGVRKKRKIVMQEEEGSSASNGTIYEGKVDQIVPLTIELRPRPKTISSVKDGSREGAS